MRCLQCGQIKTTNRQFGTFRDLKSQRVDRSRIGHESVSFCDLFVSQVTDIIQRKNSYNTLILQELYIYCPFLSSVSVIRLGFEPRTPSLKGMDKILDFNHKRKTVLTKRDLYSFNAKILLYYKHQRGTGLYFTDSLKVTTPYPLFHDWKLSKPLILYFHLYKGFKGKLYPLKYLRNVSFFTIYAASPIMPLYVQ